MIIIIVTSQNQYLIFGHKSLILSLSLSFLAAILQRTSQFNANELIESFSGFFMISWPLFYISVTVIRMSRRVFIVKMNCQNEKSFKNEANDTVYIQINEQSGNI